MNYRMHHFLAGTNLQSPTDALSDRGLTVSQGKPLPVRNNLKSSFHIIGQICLFCISFSSICIVPSEAPSWQSTFLELLSFNYSLHAFPSGNFITFANFWQGIWFLTDITKVSFLSTFCFVFTSLFFFLFSF